MNPPFGKSHFAADAQDLVHSTQRSVNILLARNGEVILNENYVHNAGGNVCVRGLSDVFSTSLYGRLDTGEQSNASAVFLLLLDDEPVWDGVVYSMRLQNPRDPDGQKRVMAVTTETRCYTGTPFLLTVIGQVPVRLYDHSGKLLAEEPSPRGDAKTEVCTADCDPATLFPVLWQQGELMTVGDEMVVHVLPPRCDRNVVVRFLNRYDMPETLVADRMEEKPATEDSTALMGGLRTRFSVKNSTEYTLHSGPLPYAGMLDTWHDLLTSRRAQLLHMGRWVDIVVTKGNWTRQRRDFYGSDLQLSFQTANPLTLL